MFSINISSLKNQLSEVLKKVQKGQDVIVLDRERAIAKISALNPSDINSNDDLLLDELEKSGVVTKPKGKKVTAQWLKNNMVKTTGSAVAAVLQEREESHFWIFGIPQLSYLFLRQSRIQPTCCASTKTVPTWWCGF